MAQHKKNKGNLYQSTRLHPLYFNLTKTLPLRSHENRPAPRKVHIRHNFGTLRFPVRWAGKEVCALLGACIYMVHIIRITYVPRGERTEQVGISTKIASNHAERRCASCIVWQRASYSYYWRWAKPRLRPTILYIW